MHDQQLRFIELTARPALTEKVLSAEPAILFSHNIINVMWANAAACALFGNGSVWTLLSEPLLHSATVVRQIENASAQIDGDNAIVRSIRISQGLRSDLVQCNLQHFAIDEERSGILLTSQDRKLVESKAEHVVASDWIAALKSMFDVAAVVDRFGLPIAASGEFGDAEFSSDQIERLIEETGTSGLPHHDEPMELADGTAAHALTLALNPSGSRFWFVALAGEEIENSLQPSGVLGTAAGATGVVLAASAIKASNDENLPESSKNGSLDTRKAEPAAAPENEREDGWREDATKQQAADVDNDADKGNTDWATKQSQPSKTVDHATIDTGTSVEAEALSAAQVPALADQPGPNPPDEASRRYSDLDAWYFPQLPRTTSVANERALEPENPPVANFSEIGNMDNDISENQADHMEIEVDTPAAETVDEHDTILIAGTQADFTDTDTKNTGDEMLKPSGFAFSPDAKPVRFAWVIDTEQKFTSVSDELASTVGPNAADVVGRSWRNLATVFGMDNDRQIAQLLERSDTWSGKSVLWPVQGTDLQVPVDLAALPTYDSGRNFEGFRGFGIIRTADAIVDPDEIGLSLMPGHIVPVQPTSGSGNIVNLADRLGDDVVRKRERDGPVDQGPSEPMGEREALAFSEIGKRLRKTSDAEWQVDNSGPDDDEHPANSTGFGLIDSKDADAAAPLAPFADFDRPQIDPIEAEPATDEPANKKSGPDDAGYGRALLEDLPIPVIAYRGDRILHANTKLLELTGYASPQALADAGGIAVLFGGGMEIQPERQGLVALHALDGEVIDVEAHLHKVPWDGEKALLLSFLAPDTEAAGVGASDQLNQIRVRELNDILETATDGIIVIEQDGLIRSVSGSAQALFGHDAADLVGQHFSTLFARESQQSATDYLAGLTAPGVAGVLNDGREVIGLEAGGGMIPLFMTLGRIGEDGAFCAVLRDITQWKQAEEELTASRRKAEEASDQKSDFLARISHEIRTPLNAIIGFSDVMIGERFGPINNDRYREYLRDINRSGIHVLDLINDLLDISKIEAGKMELTFEAVDLNQVVGETVALLQPSANGERVIIRTSLSNAVPKVVADARSIRQIVLNLVSNAIKFTPENGQVIVSSAYEESGEVALKVRDTGRGMSEKDIQIAMQPFQQTGAVRENQVRGTGLGLPLTKALVEANRAYFDIESTPGEGTLVHVNFPTTRVLAD